MKKLLTVQRAKQEIARLEHFVGLVESYETNTIEKWIIREYAYTNSIVEVVKSAKFKKLTRDGYFIERDYIISVIDGKPNDELHKIMKLGYRHKIRPNKRKSYEYK